MFPKRKYSHLKNIEHVTDARVGLITGIIMLVGLSRLTEVLSSSLREELQELFWPLIITIFGVLIFAGGLYRYGRRY